MPQQISQRKINNIKNIQAFLLAVRSAGIYQEKELQLFDLQKIKPNAVEIERLYRISTKHFMNDYSSDRMPLSNGKVRPNQVNLAITKKLRWNFLLEWSHWGAYIDI